MSSTTMQYAAFTQHHVTSHLCQPCIITVYVPGERYLDHAPR